MTQAIRSPSASSQPTKSFEKVFGTAVETTTSTRCEMFAFADYTPAPPVTPPKHSTIDDLIAEWGREPEGSAALTEGRRWVGSQFYGEDGDTVRTLRLKKGWSQSQLAEALGTSQSHVARIERGTENITIETCRKLSRALEIDLNALDQALARQESIAQARME